MLPGDGTTTATLQAQALIREGMKNVAAGANPMIVKKGIQKAVDAAVKRCYLQTPRALKALQISQELQPSPQVMKMLVT